MIIGFTGTSKDMTPQQVEGVEIILHDYHCEVLHHGDCIGSDATCHRLARALPWKVRIIGHLPLDDSKRAFCDFDEIMPKLPYLKRNYNISLAAGILVATPKEFAMIVRSGTWSTVRYAEAQKTPRLIIFPDGSMRRENS